MPDEARRPSAAGGSKGLSDLLTPIILAGLAVGGILAAGTLTSQVFLALMIAAITNALLAVSVGFLLRQNGWLSFGHAAYYGIGAYLAAIGINQGLPLEVVVPASIAAAALLAFLFGMVVGRLSGIALGMLTLAIGQTFFEIANRVTFVGGTDGMSVGRPHSLLGIPASAFFDRVSMFSIGWCLLLLILFILYLLSRSRFGQVGEAIRENAERARFLGYRTLPRQAAVYAISAALAAVAGIYGTLYSGFVSPEQLELKLSGFALIMALLGGTGRNWGPVIGALFYTVLRDFIGNMTENWLFIVGATMVIVVVALPNGITGLLTAGADLAKRLLSGNRRPEDRE